MDKAQEVGLKSDTLFGTNPELVILDDVVTEGEVTEGQRKKLAEYYERRHEYQ